MTGDRGNGAAHTRQINDLLAAVLAGLDLPEPAAYTDEAAYLRLLDDRTMWVRSILRRVVDRGIGSVALDLPAETARLREQLRRYPVTYPVAARPAGGDPAGS